MATANGAHSAARVIDTPPPGSGDTEVEAGTVAQAPSKDRSEDPLVKKKGAGNAGEVSAAREPDTSKVSVVIPSKEVTSNPQATERKSGIIREAIICDGKEKVLGRLRCSSSRSRTR